MRHNYSPGEPISITEWIRGNGKLAKECLRQFYRFNGGAALRAIQPRLARFDFGKSPFEYDWDACIAFDACRVDALRAVADEFDWLPPADDIGSVRSAASHSRGWYRKALDFDRYGEEMAKTALVTWNPHSNIDQDPDDWALFDEVWRDCWDDDRGLIDPRDVTERAIHAARNSDAERLLVHYQQPHDPYPGIQSDTLRSEHFTGEDVKGGSRRTAWERCIDAGDDINPEVIWPAMLDNLRWVLGEIEVLLENLDAERVLLTADHGECFGEFGIHSHAEGVPLPWLINVPFVWLSAADTQTVTPEIEVGEMEADVMDRLESLGYR